MSTLKDRITEDMKAAMRARDSERLSTIRMLLAACKQREVDERIELDDNAVVGLVDKLIKQRKDSITAFQQGGRTDLADKESAEVRVLRGLPAAAAGCRRDRRRGGGHRRRTGRQRPGRHGPGDGRGQGPAGRQGRDGAGVGSRQAGPVEVGCAPCNTHLPLRAIADDVCVAPQLTPAAMAEVARAGFRAVVNNRPDFEEGADAADQRADRGRGAGRRPGIPLPAGERRLPVARRGRRDGATAAELPRPLLMFCRSGARSTRLFALAQSV